MTENPQLTEQDIADLEALGEAEEGPQHSLLFIWSDVLSHVEKSLEEPVPMGVAGRIVAGWPSITMQQTPLYHRLYHEILLDLRELLAASIADNPGCTEYVGADDLEQNYEIYKALVIGWNIYLDELESEWDPEHEHSHVTYAALVDARGFMFSRQGLAGHLEAIGFQLDSSEIVEAIRAMREGSSE